MKNQRISSRLLTLVGSIVVLAALLLSMGSSFPAQAGAGQLPTGTGFLPTSSVGGTGTSIPPTGGASVTFEGGDEALCQAAPATLQAVVDINLPAGQQALLQAAFNIVHPNTNDTRIIYQNTPVTGGQKAVITGNWPGANGSDSLVEVHFGALLLDPVTLNPISSAAGKDFYWYPWYCNVAATPGVPNTGGVTATPVIGVTVVPSGATLAPTGTGTAVSTAVPGQTGVPSTATQYATQVPATSTPVPTLTTVPTNTTYPTSVLGETAVASPTLPVLGSTAQPTQTSTVGIPNTGGTAVPTVEATSQPTYEATVGIPDTGASNLVVFAQDDIPVCQMTAGTLNTSVTINLPAGVNQAVMQSYVEVLSPYDLRTLPLNPPNGRGALHGLGNNTLGSGDANSGTSAGNGANVTAPGQQKKPVLKTQLVTNSQAVNLTAAWPGVRSSDKAVELRVVVRVLNRNNGRLIGTKTMFFFWYPWVCDYLNSNPLPVPTTTAAPSSTVPAVTGTVGVPNTGATGTAEVFPSATAEMTGTAVVLPSATAEATGTAEVLPSATSEVTGTPVVLPSATAEFTGTPGIPPTGNTLSFENGDQAVCQMNSGPLSAVVDVNLPDGQSAILQASFDVVEPADLATQIQYVEVNVTGSNRVEITGFWPGVRAADQVAEVHFGAILLDPATHNPISAGASKDYFWYPYVCSATEGTSVPSNGTPVPTAEFGATVIPGTAVPPTSVANTPAAGETSISNTGATPVVGATVLPGNGTPVGEGTARPTTVPVAASIQFVQQSGPFCTVARTTVPATVVVTLPRGMKTAILRTGYRIVAPFSAHTNYVYRDRIVKNGQRFNLSGIWPGIVTGNNLVAAHFDAILLDVRGKKPLISTATLDYFAYAQVCQSNGTPVPSGTPGASAIFGNVPVTGSNGLDGFASTWNDFWTRVFSLFGRK